MWPYPPAFACVSTTRGFLGSHLLLSGVTFRGRAKIYGSVRRCCLIANPTNLPVRTTAHPTAMTFKTTAILLEDFKTLLLAHSPAVSEYIEALLLHGKIWPLLAHVTN